MGTFAKGLIAGGAIGALGLAVAMTDKRTRRKFIRDGRRAINNMGIL